MLRVKEICKEKGLTVANVANKMGIMPPALSRIINGSNTTTDTLYKIANALDVPISELFEQPATDTIVCPKCHAKFRMEN